MKKFNLFAIIFVLIFISFGTNYVPKVFASVDNQINIRAYGDSISAGYGLDDFENYLPPKDSGLTKTSDLTKDCFTDVFSKPYLEYFGGKAVGYGVDGYESSDLVNILQPYQSGVAIDYQDFVNTDIFTLCIGANNIMHLAEANFQKFIDGTITDSSYRKLLSDAVAVFEEDYNTVIIPTLTAHKAYVLVMTIYNPYKYTSLKDVTVDTKDQVMDTTIKTILSAIDVTLQEYLDITMYYLQQINSIIKSSESEQVYVADIWGMCENLTQAEHKEYFDVDASRVVITEPTTDVNLSMFLEHCDPHPTASGHNAIAGEFFKQFKYFNFELKTDLSTINYNSQNLIFNINSIQTEKYGYKLVKRVNNQLVDICTANANIFEVKAEHFNGTNEIFVQVYQNNKLVFNTNALRFSLSVIDDPNQPSNSETDIQSPQNNNQQLNSFQISMLCLMSILSFIILVLVIRIVVRKIKA